MKDETFDRISEFVKRNAIPAGEVFEKGIPVPVYVDEEVPDDEPELVEKPCALRLSRADHEDLRRRLMLGGTEMKMRIDSEGDDTLRSKGG